MKLYLVVLIAALATAVAGTSVPNVVPDALLEARGVYRRANYCSAFWSGKCERYCGCYGFSHMEKGPCGRFKKRCCCRS
jgi:hypothetical protein